MKEVPIEVKPIFSADNEEEVVKMTYILRQLLLVRNGNYTKDDPFYLAIQRERMGEISELESKLDTAMIQLRFVPPPHSPEYANNVAPYPYNISFEILTRYKNKNGVEDLEKAAHYLRIMIEREKAKDASNT